MQVKRKNNINCMEYLKYIGTPIPKSRLIFKRILDIILGILGVLISIPMIIIFGILIKLTSEGPIFFKQKRVGYMGKEFYIVKLRSMRNNAESTTGAIWAKKMIVE